MRRALLAPLVLALMASQASEAAACSLVWRNMFSDFGEPPGARVLREARYVDWVEIVAKGPPACERDRAWTAAEIEAEEAETQPVAIEGDPNAFAPARSAPPSRPNQTAEGFDIRSCYGRALTGPLHALEARVIEPVKGEGGGVFPLAYSWAPDVAPENAYSDPRTAMIEVEQGLPTDHADAVTLHGDPGFTDHGELHVDRDDTDSCGGAPTAMIGGRYVAFRSAKGAVLTLEPVAARDDPWFDRLRRYATDPEAFGDPPLDIADFFRASTGVAVVRVTSCHRPGGRTGEARIKAKALRGTFSAGWMSRQEKGLSFEWIPDYLQRIGAPCRGGMTLLAMSGPFDRDGGSPPRAARLTGTQFRKADLLSGYALTGPDTVSVDQAFAWVEEGRKAREAAP